MQSFQAQQPTTFREPLRGMPTSISLHYPVLGLSCIIVRGSTFSCYDGQTRFFHPIPVAYVGDLVEAASIFDVRPFPAARPDVNYLIHKNEMGLANPPLEPRTEKGMTEV